LLAGSLFAHSHIHPGVLLDSPAKADASCRDARFYKWYLARLEYLVGDQGFAVGSRLSLADVLLRYTLAETLTEAQCGKPDLAAATASWRREPLMSSTRTAALLAEFPKLQRIVQNVANQPGLVQWLESRGTQMF
jgi:glutathione S-transferase